MIEPQIVCMKLVNNLLRHIEPHLAFILIFWLFVFRTLSNHRSDVAPESISTVRSSRKTIIPKAVRLATSLGLDMISKATFFSFSTLLQKMKTIACWNAMIVYIFTKKIDLKRMSDWHQRENIYKKNLLTTYFGGKSIFTWKMSSYSCLK